MGGREVQLGENIFGFALCVVLQRSSSITIWRALYALSYFIVVMVWQRVERRSHAQRMDMWQYLRRQGMFFFVLTRYTALRGTILTMIFVGPIYAEIDSLTLMVFASLIYFITSIIGYKEWSACEDQHRASLVREAATSIRARQN